MKMIKTILLRAAIAASSVLLLACGGGAGGVGSASIVTAAKPASLSLGVKTADVNAIPTNAMAPGQTLRAVALFTDSASAPLKKAIVTFSIGTSPLAIMSIPSGQAVTDDAGIATIDITALNPNVGGVVLVTATAVKDGVTTTSGDWPISVSPAAGSNTAVAAAFEISTSASQLGSSGTTSATITVTAKNANNAVVKDVTVNFKTSSGNLQVINSVTDVNGVARAVVSVGANKENRIITVEASSGTVTTTVEIDVTGTVLNISGPSAVAINSPVQLTGTLKDSTGNPIANTDVMFTSALGNGASRTCVPSTCKTNSGGSVTLTYTPTVGGLDVLRLSALGASAAQEVAAASSEIKITGTPDTGSSNSAEFSIGQNSKIFSIAMSGPATLFPATLNLSSTAGLISNSTVIIPSSGSPVNVTLSTGVSVGQGVIFAQHAIAGGVSNTFPFEIVSRTPSRITLQSSPNVIPANTDGGSVNQADVSATAFDSTGNPVKGVSVTFALASNASGGKLLFATAITNSAGIASTSYIAGPSPAAGAGVTVRAAVTGVPAASSSITVAQQALFVNFGFGNKLLVPNNTTYEQEFSVTVTDAAGRGVAGANVAVALKAGKFYKGTMVPVATSINSPPSRWGITTVATPATLATPLVLPSLTATCANEDIDHNGNIQAGEDINNNGRLEPGVRPVVSQVSGGIKANTTDATGFAMYKISYLKDNALWSEYEVSVATATVNGDSQGVAKQTYLLRVLADDVDDLGIRPPNEVSPFGVDSSCASTM